MSHAWLRIAHETAQRHEGTWIRCGHSVTTQASEGGVTGGFNKMQHLEMI